MRPSVKFVDELKSRRSLSPAACIIWSKINAFESSGSSKGLSPANKVVGRSIVFPKLLSTLTGSTKGSPGLETKWIPRRIPSFFFFSSSSSLPHEFTHGRVPGDADHEVFDVNRSVLCVPLCATYTSHRMPNDLFWWKFLLWWERTSRPLLSAKGARRWIPELV